MRVGARTGRSWSVEVPVLIVLALVFSCFLVVSLGLGTLFWFNAGEESRLVERIERTTTSTAAEARAAADGTLVEVSGTAVAHPEVEQALPIAPLSGQSVLAWEVTIEEWDQGRRSGSGRQRTGEGWQQRESAQGSTVFLVEDGSGRVAVNAAGADLRGVEAAQQTYDGGIDGPTAERLTAAGVELPSLARNGSGSWRVTESVILPGDSVFVLGPIRVTESEPLFGVGAGDDLLVRVGTEESVLAEVRDDARLSRLLAYVMFGVAGVTVLLLIVVGFVAARRRTPRSEPVVPATPTGGQGTGPSPWRPT